MMLAGQLDVGTIVVFSQCGCEFRVDGRDSEYPAHVIFNQSTPCGKGWECNMNNGQQLWLFDDEPIANVPGRYSFTVKEKDNG